jgi:hypothetical protein
VRTIHSSGKKYKVRDSEELTIADWRKFVELMHQSIALDIIPDGPQKLEAQTRFCTGVLRLFAPSVKPKQIFVAEDRDEFNAALWVHIRAELADFRQVFEAIARGGARQQQA